MLESIFANPVFAAADDRSSAVLLLVLFFGTFASEDLACIAAGNLAASGRLSFSSVTIACFFGILTGDMLLFLSGRLAGRYFCRSKLLGRFLSSGKTAHATEWLNRRGASAVFVSRFVSGLRLPTYLAAGMLGTSFRKFVLCFVAAAAIWTPLLVGAAVLGQTFIPAKIVVGMIGLFFVGRFLIKLRSWKYRRLFYGKLKRIARWEFWPLPVFYLPVVLYVLMLALKHRSLTAFTAANPGILAGGFVGESKDEIYALIMRSGASQDHLLRYTRISACLPALTRGGLATDFIESNALSFPIILKPDAGERGKGVFVVGSREELDVAIRESNEDILLQEFAGGVEASVFYYRLPSEAKGIIFSVTEKKFPFVEGDGSASVEELILKDDRAVSLAKSYFEQNRHRLYYIPAAGEKVQLIQIGTHSKGAIFLEGSWLDTPALQQRIDEVCREIPGFNFGRFDLRAESFEKLRKGEGFKIIELNGVTSESTNIYDPQYSLLDAYRILFRQWSIAFRIGQENLDRGARAFPISKLVALIFFGPNPMDEVQRFNDRAIGNKLAGCA